jgi:hypothetical protein
MTAKEIADVVRTIAVLTSKFDEAVKILNDVADFVYRDKDCLNTRVTALETRQGNGVTWKWVAGIAVSLIMSASMIFLASRIGS